MNILKREKKIKEINGEFVPCVVYSKGFNYMGQIKRSDARKLVYKGVYAEIQNINVDGKDINVIVKEIQFHPISRDILHLDFFKITEDAYVNLFIDIVPVCVSECEAVKLGCTLVAKKKIKVKCLSSCIKKEIEVDVSGLKPGYSVFSDEIKMPGFKFDKRIALVSAIEGGK